MIKYIEPPAYYDPWEILSPAVFLAGGITGCEDWQAEAVEMIKESGRDITVLNPRRKNFPINDPAAGWEQVSWEQKNLHTARVHTLFWFPPCDPAVTTQPIAMFELGQAMGEERPMTIGVDPDYPRQADIHMLCRLNQPDRLVYKNLEDTVDVVLSRLFRRSS